MNERIKDKQESFSRNMEILSFLCWDSKYSEPCLLSKHSLILYIYIYIYIYISLGFTTPPSEPVLGHDTTDPGGWFQISVSYVLLNACPRNVFFCFRLKRQVSCSDEQ